MTESPIDYKKLTFFLLAFLIFSCIQNKKVRVGNIIYDNRLDNRFFHEDNAWGTDGFTSVDGDTTYESYYEYEINARVHDIKNHVIFDTCKSYFSNDTLLISFSQMQMGRYWLILKIFNENLYATIRTKNRQGEYPAKPELLRLRNKVIKRGDKVFGEVQISAYDSLRDRPLILKGPFYCVVQ